MELLGYGSLPVPYYLQPIDTIKYKEFGKETSKTQLYSFRTSP